MFSYLYHLVEVIFCLFPSEFCFFSVVLLPLIIWFYIQNELFVGSLLIRCVISALNAAFPRVVLGLIFFTCSKAFRCLRGDGGRRDLSLKWCSQGCKTHLTEDNKIFV